MNIIGIRVVLLYNVMRYGSYLGVLITVSGGMLSLPIGMSNLTQLMTSIKSPSGQLRGQPVLLSQVNLGLFHLEIFPMHCAYFQVLTTC